MEAWVELSVPGFEQTTDHYNTAWMNTQPQTLALQLTNWASQTDYWSDEQQCSLQFSFRSTENGDAGACIRATASISYIEAPAMLSPIM